METTGRDETGHPVASFVRDSSERLAALVDVPLWSLGGDETAALVRRVTSLAAQVAELEARVLGHADDLGLAAESGMRSTAAWVAATTRLTRAEAHRRTRLTSATASCGATRSALARGDVHVEQALAVHRCLDELGLDDEHVVSVEERLHAEAFLLDHARDHDAKQLATLGQRLVETLDPEGADAHEDRRLARQEARARKHTRLVMADDGEGLTRGSFAVPTAQAAVLKKMLWALAAPKAQRAEHGAGSYDWRRPTPARLGQAFCDLIERYPAAELPQIGGVNATIVITADHDVLLGRVKAAVLETGDKVSSGELRRLACEADLLPAVMDGDSVVLDLGRQRRLHDKHQRIALTVERRTCEHADCDTLAAFCHVHHSIPWSQGGPTDVRHAVLLCPFHHHKTHATGASYPLRT